MQEFVRRNNGVRLGFSVSEVVEELIVAKEEDGMSHRYLLQLRSILRIFAKDFPGPILHVKGDQIDRWLRESKLAPVTRNNRLTVLRVLFNFAKQRNYTWSMERRMIHLRAGQAKTASRRIVPMSENLVAWLELVEREGKVFKRKALPWPAPILAKSLGMRWPNNVLRHSFISDRVAETQDVNQVALEAGNSSAIIFRHYRELVDAEAAERWFAIQPPNGWAPAGKR